MPQGTWGRSQDWCLPMPVFRFDSWRPLFVVCCLMSAAAVCCLGVLSKLMSSDASFQVRFLAPPDTNTQTQPSLLPLFFVHHLFTPQIHCRKCSVEMNHPNDRSNCHVTSSLVLVQQETLGVSSKDELWRCLIAWSKCLLYEAFKLLMSHLSCNNSSRSHPVLLLQIGYTCYAR